MIHSAGVVFNGPCKRLVAMAEIANIRVNLPELSVSELSLALKRTIEDGYGYVRVRGELGNVKYHSSGHIYLDLKDDKACLAGVVWRTAAPRIKLKLEAGLEVVVTGRITTFPGQSKYQIVIESLEPAGVGALMALLEERKKKLAAEGLFDEARKQLLPYLPNVIGVVTSPTGAVIRDILHRLSDRFPRRVLLWPVRVQGDGSAERGRAARRAAPETRFARRAAAARLEGKCRDPSQAISALRHQALAAAVAWARTNRAGAHHQPDRPGAPLHAGASRQAPRTAWQYRRPAHDRGARQSGEPPPAYRARPRARR